MKQIKLAFILLTIMIVLGNCTFENRTTTTKMCLEGFGHETGKYYWFDYSTPRPIIVTAEEIIFPMEYNIVNRGVESTDTFNIIDNQLEP